MKTTAYFLFFVCFSFAPSLFGQNISFEIPEGISVCQNYVFGVSIKNTTSATLKSVRYELIFPCEIEYIPSSVTGDASEIDLSNLNRPIFKTSNIPVGAVFEFNVTVLPSCELLECLDNQSKFKNRLNLSYTGGNPDPIFSQEYNIERPLLVFTKIEESILYGVQGETLLRKLTVKNTNKGALSSFVFTNEHYASLGIKTNVGNELSSSSPFELNVEFSAQEFMEIGDGDALFEFNEEIIIEEEIYITTCRISNPHVLSTIKLSWGCDDKICEEFSQNTAVIITEKEINIVEIEPFISDPSCFCDDKIKRQGLVIKNISSESDIHEFILEIDEQSESGFIVDNSIKFAIGTDTFPFPTNKIVEFDPKKKFFILEIEELLVESQIAILWDVYFIKQVPCENESNRWKYNAHYKKQCINGEVLETIPQRVVNQYPYLIISSISKALRIQDDQQFVMLAFDSELLDDENGKFRIDLILPCGVLLDSPNWELSGQVPETVDISIIGDETHIYLEYLTPLVDVSDSLAVPILIDTTANCLDSSFLKQKVLITSCEDPFCGKLKNIAPLLISAITTVIFDEDCDLDCHPRYCASNIIGFPIPNSSDSTYLDTIPGYMDHGLEFFRTNVGLVDNDDDHRPDVSGELNLDKIRLDHAVYGDTMRAIVKGEVIMDQENHSFSKLILRLKVGLNGFFDISTPADFAKLFEYDANFLNIKNELTIWDKDKNHKYQISNIEYLKDSEFVNDTLIEFIVDLSPEYLISKGGNIPSDYLYEAGDSISFSSDFIVNYNFGQDVNGFRYIPMYLKSNVLMSNDSIVDVSNNFFCYCPVQPFDIANIAAQINSENGGLLDICKDEIDLNGRKVIIKMGVFPNFFPYEYKPTTKLAQYNIPQIEGLDLIETSISSVAVNGEEDLNFFPKYIIEASEYIERFEEYDCEDILGYYVFEFPDSIGLRYDDNIVFLINAKYKNNDCYFNGNSKYKDTLGIEYRILPENETYGYDVFRSVKHRIYGKNHTLDVEYEICDATSLDDSIFWNITLNHDYLKTCRSFKNKQFLSNAPNVFLYPQSVTGLVDEFRVFNRDTGEEYFSEQGYFDLDTLFTIPQSTLLDSIRLQVTAKNHSCVKEDVLFRFGWNCEMMIDSMQTPCWEDTLICSVLSTPGVLLLLPDTLAISADLCSEMPWSKIEVIDAGLGAIFNLKLLAQLPIGLEYTIGTTELSWTTLDQNYVAIVDPIDLGGGLYEWNIQEIMNEFWDHGFPGVHDEPNNSLSIRFKTLSNCDFVSGSYITYYGEGAQVCGDPTNKVLKIGAPMHISSVSIDENNSISGTYEFADNCRELIKLNVHFESISPTGSSDRIGVQLPPNVFYVDQSCEGVNINCEPTIDGTFLTWDLSEGFTIIDFSFLISGFETNDCYVIEIPLYSTTILNALCVSTNEDCSIDVFTGQEILTVNLEKPIFEIHNVVVNYQVNDNNIEIEYEISNTGIENIDPIIVQLYYDKDGNGIVTSEDELLGDYSYDEFLENGDSFIANIVRDLSAVHQICSYLIVIDEEVNCICEDNQAAISAQITVHDYFTDTICSNVPLVLGIDSIPGFNYEWTNEDHLSCESCSHTTFSYENNGFNPEEFDFELIIQNDDGCYISLEYKILVLPDLRIWYAPESICAGEEILLIASESSNYHWQGMGISDPANQVQILVPLETSTYYLTITNEEGCEAFDSTTIIVNEYPEANAGDDIEVCYGSQIQLMAVDEPGVSYSWTPGFPFIDNPNISNPMVLSEIDTSYILTVDNGNCIDTDTVQISFKEFLDINVNGNFPICFGDTLILNLTGADSYSWSPWTVEMCQNASCSEVAIVVDENTSFVATGTNVDGCIGSIIIDVIVVNDIAISTIDTTICSDQSIILFEEEVFMSGLYCDTIVFNSGCTKITCFDLTILDSINIDINVKLCQGDTIHFGTEVLEEAGNYTHNFISNSGCDSIVNLEIEIIDLVSISSNLEICEGDTIVFYDQIVIEEGSYEYIKTNEDACDTLFVLMVEFSEEITIIDSIDICFGESYLFNGIELETAGTYCMDSIDMDGCVIEKCVELNVFELPIITFDLTNLIVQEGSIIDLSVIENYPTYSWTSTEDISCDDCQSISATINNTTIFYVEVVDENACTNTNEITVTVQTECLLENILIPNAFTPNNDGHNDRFRVVNYKEDQHLIQISIFNRWGELIYESNDNTGWDGTMNGKEAPAEGYIYMIRISCIGEETKLLKGDMTLLRQ